MTRVYWRIFLAFWTVLIMTVIVTAAVNSIVFRDEVAISRADALRGSLGALAEQAERRLRQDGPAGLHDWLRDRQQDPSLPPLLIVDPTGREIMNRPVPPGARMMLNRDRGAKPGDDRRRHMFERFERSVNRFRDADGNQYVMMIPRFKPRAGGWFAAAQARAVFPIVLVIVSGITCLLLARYLTRPIAAFRTAGQSIAAGDLHARVGSDVARRKDEFGDLARDFDDMAGRVEQLVDTQQRLLRDVSHELRSPLARLQAAVGLLRQRGSDDENVDRIEREIEVLDELIGQVLGYSRLQAKTSPAIERTDLVELMRAIVDDASYEGIGENIGIAFAPERPEFADVDPGLMRSAVDNVVRNALQYADTLVAINVERDESQKSVRISVCDDGPGVAEDDLQQVFEPFFTTRSAAGGAGIGLAIAKRAVELHGGSISARNGDGRGLLVTIELRIPTDA